MTDNNKFASLFQKIVFITGLFNFPIGIGVITQAFMSQNSELLPVQATLGTFIIFTGAVLMWASQNLQLRAPVIVWNAFVRFTAFIVILYTSTIGAVPAAFIAIAGMDVIVALVYIIGSTKSTGIPFSKLLLGKS